MAFAHPEYLVPSVIALVLALYPLPWHLRTGNIATLSMIFWMTLLNIVHIVNCIVWVDSSAPRANWWGDISTLIIVTYNYALPTAHLVLAKQLESFTSLRPHSPLYDSSARKRHRIFDISVTIGAPVVGYLIHLSNMDRRFYIVERLGPQAATYWNAWGVIWMAIVPILIAVTVVVYTIMALVNIYLRRQQMLSLIASDASVNRDQFYRLMFLTISEVGTCGLRAIFNLMSFQNGPQPMGHRGAPFHNLTKIESIEWSSTTTSGRLTLHLSFFTVVACSYVFFMCFATSTETKRFYSNVVRKIFPCIPESRTSRIHKLGSVDTGMSRSNAIGTYSSATTGPISPTTPKDMDISLEEMLHAPALGKNGHWAISRGLNRVGLAPSVTTQESKYEEETADALYLPSMAAEEKTSSSMV
ncbi:pheromone a factor receptor [Cryptococcus neoformans]|nr:pheromone a factor receptor [Cryptococcus neoformans var. grubii AD1-7a]OXH37387.1 pheromone a factor receptor [Cryptococcus neoformans var. grubii]